jgi:hypothetical protein
MAIEFKQEENRHMGRQKMMCGHTEGECGNERH